MIDKLLEVLAKDYVITGNSDLVGVCKDWAHRQGYYLPSWKESKILWGSRLDAKDRFLVIEFTGRDEEEAILKATIEVAKREKLICQNNKS